MTAYKGVPRSRFCRGARFDQELPPWKLMNTSKPRPQRSSSHPHRPTRNSRKIPLLALYHLERPTCSFPNSSLSPNPPRAPRALSSVSVLRHPVQLLRDEGEASCPLLGRLERPGRIPERRHPGLWIWLGIRPCPIYADSRSVMATPGGWRWSVSFVRVGGIDFNSNRMNGRIQIDGSWMSAKF